MKQKQYSKTSDAIVLAASKEEMKLLLIKRKNVPFKNQWALPGGFIEEGESPEEAATRELFEETGLDLGKSKGLALDVRSRKGRDPRGEVASHPFLFYQENTTPSKGGSDALEAEWVSLRDIESLAFDHGAILCEAIGKFWKYIDVKHDDFKKNVELPTFLEKQKNLDNAKTEGVTFFGGSFNPWHEGHRACLDLCPANNIVVIPDTSPFKNVGNRDENHCFWKDFKEICLALEKDSFGIFPGFFGREKSNPTADWFTRLPFKNKGLLVGDDSFFQLESWFHSKDLLDALSHLYIVPRKRSIPEIDKERQRLKKTSSNISIKILPEHNYQNLSSSKIRNLR